ncbi:MAG: Alanine dehydrogenase 2 [Chlamydiae bacterium]|nr:Alanine dehydrogenase 2 [Chlamydiota bacterium]
MLIGIPKEVKNHEYRVGANPELVYNLTHAGHEVVIETNAGKSLGYTDETYQKVGAKIVQGAKEAWDADMVIKVKEPQPAEFPFMRENLILFCFLHLSPEPELTKALIDNKVIAIAWETVTDKKRQLPILIPMSEIAGRISIQAGATALQLSHGGKGLLMGGVPGVAPANVVVIGGGIVGLNAARMAQGLGAHVTILDVNLERLREIDNTFDFKLRTVFSTEMAIEKVLQSADLVVGAVLIPGKLAPKVVTNDMLKLMQPRSVIVDVAIDQGGCFESSRPTSHEEPTYIQDDIVHYCVTNMPGVCAKTATRALMNAITSYALELANLGYKKALLTDPGLVDGLNVYRGKVTNEHVATDLGYDYHPWKSLI